MTATELKVNREHLVQRNTVPYLMANSNVGYIQTCWSFLNPNESYLTKARAPTLRTLFSLYRDACFLPLALPGGGCRNVGAMQLLARLARAALSKVAKGVVNFNCFAKVAASM